MRKFRVAVNGNTYEIDIEEITESGAVPDTPVKSGTARTPAQPAAPPKPSPAHQAPADGNGGSGLITAQMPGTIIEIRVSTGDTVKRGEPMVILEAMKMANEVVAPADGTVDQIHVEPNGSVNAGDPLVTLI